MQERLQVLFIKFQNDSLSPEEWKEWEQMLNNPELEQDIYLLMEEKWNQQESGDPRFQRPLQGDRVIELVQKNAADNRLDKKSTPVVSWQKLLIAASVLMIVSLAGFWILKQPSPSTMQVENNPVQNPIPETGWPGSDRAVLSLADGTEILLDTAHRGALAQQGMIQVLKNDEGLLSYLPSPEKDLISQGNLLPNRIATPRGGQYRLVLSDGTRVWLNAATSLRFPVAFANNERRVELSGEAYFEVEKDAARPFRVQLSDHTEVEVLGTHFNIMSYDEEGVNKTTLVEGKVKVSAGNETKVLQPGDQAMNKGNKVIQLKNNTNTDQVLAWKKGLFDFSSDDLGSIALQLERWYGVDISFEGKVAQKHISGVISRNNHLDTVLKMLEFTAGIHSRREGGKLFFFTKNGS